MDNRIRRFLPRRAKSGASADAFIGAGPTSPTSSKQLAESSIRPSFEDHGHGLRSISYEAVVAGKTPTFGLTPQKGNGPVKLQTSRRLSSGEVLVTSQDEKRTFEDIREGDYIVGRKERRESHSLQRDRTTSAANLYQPLHAYDRTLPSPRLESSNLDLAPTSPRLPRTAPLPAIPNFGHDHFDHYAIDFRTAAATSHASNQYPGATGKLEPLVENATVETKDPHVHRHSLSADDGSDDSTHKRLSFISSVAGSHHTNRTSVAESDAYNPREEISKLIEDMRRNYIRASEGEVPQSARLVSDIQQARLFSQQSQLAVRPSTSVSTNSATTQGLGNAHSGPHLRHQSWSANPSSADPSSYFGRTTHFQNMARSASHPTDRQSAKGLAIYLPSPESDLTAPSSATTAVAMPAEAASGQVATPTSATMPTVDESDGDAGLKRADSTTLGSLLDAEIKRSSIANRRKARTQAETPNRDAVDNVEAEPQLVPQADSVPKRIEDSTPPPRPAPPPFLWDDVSDTSLMSEQDLLPNLEFDSFYDSSFGAPSSDMLWEANADDAATGAKRFIGVDDCPILPQIVGEGTTALSGEMF